LEIAARLGLDSTLPMRSGLVASREEQEQSKRLEQSKRPTQSKRLEQ